MKPRVQWTVTALRHFGSHFEYLARNAGVQTAWEFQEALDAAIAYLRDFPEIGPPKPLEDWKNLRMWQVERFRDYIILYNYDELIEVVGLVHSSQDIYRVFKSQ